VNEVAPEENASKGRVDYAFKIKGVNLTADELRNTHHAVQQKKHYRVVPEARGGQRVRLSNESLYLLNRESRDHLFGRLWYLELRKGVPVDYSLRLQPGPEGPQRAHIGVNRMS